MTKKETDKCTREHLKEAKWARGLMDAMRSSSLTDSLEFRATCNEKFRGTKNLRYLDGIMQFQVETKDKLPLHVRFRSLTFEFS